MPGTSKTDSSNIGQNTTTYNVILPSDTAKRIQTLKFVGDWIEYQFPTTANISTYTFNSTAFPAEWYILGYKSDKDCWVVMHHVSFIGKELNIPAYNTPDTTWEIKTHFITNRIRFHTTVAVLNFVELNNLLFYDDVGDHKAFLIPFCTQTNSMTHTGSLNFSQINDFSINMTPTLQTEFFAVGVNTLCIESGMANLMYT
jgi:hypothetical protein